ncbi:hypothetical protein RHMOL_Rhmol04G0245900 [Rhododendron molle]|uniref:Uncharacterized protein n=1 Tax=Rhododendron molle TaxID=49168 RepID=A0ACC0P562_RHOML|nr:hypothetical protein RHMOL_Rhmol04G0245900 [Rhododendron molle]
MFRNFRLVLHEFSKAPTSTSATSSIPNGRGGFGFGVADCGGGGGPGGLGIGRGGAMDVTLLCQGCEESTQNASAATVGIIKVYIETVSCFPDSWFQVPILSAYGSESPCIIRALSAHSFTGAGRLH